MPDPELTVIIPTRNERANVLPLVTAVAAALSAIAWEALFVDDSIDGTDLLVASLAPDYPQVRLLHRDQPAGGLAGAVVAGFAEARGVYCCVIDGDLQHPPAVIPRLLATAHRHNADLVIASRYRPGGSAGGLAGFDRQAVSRGLKLLARLAFPLRLRGITDPLGGFFLVRRSVVAGVTLRPVGYKILLEVLVRCPWRRARETPYRFAPRHAGQTKASLRQGLRFLHHLSRLIWECSPALRPIRLLRDRQRKEG